MTLYHIRFFAIVEREVEVPNGLDWSEAYQFVRDQLGWHEIAHSSGAKTTIDVSSVLAFRKTES